MAKGNCEFNGSGRQYLAVFIVHLFILSFITLGIYSPWAWVKLFRLRASHTRINGKSVSFTGTGGDFFLTLLINGLLTLITFGIYWPWASVRISGWRAQHTLVDNTPSSFTGSGGSLFGFSLVHFMILPLITFGLYYFYAMYRFYAWKEEHFRYGGAKTSFGASFWGLLQIYIIFMIILMLFPAVGPLLHMPSLDWISPLVFIVLSPWLMCMFFKWQTEGLVVGDEPGIEHFKPVQTRFIWILILFLIGLLVLAGGGYLLKDQVEKQLAGMKDLSLILEIESQPTQKPDTLRLPVKRSAPGTTQKAEQKTDEPSPAKKAVVAPDKNIVIPKWTASQKASMPDFSKEKNALEKLDKALSENNQNDNAYYNRGCIYAYKGDLENALKDFTKAIEINSQSSDAYCNRGSVYFQQGRTDLAIKDYNKALELNPRDADLYYNRGLAYLKQENKKAAEMDFKKATDLKASSSKSLGKQ